jgi:ABC-2 type transport system ATP-binding protein
VGELLLELATPRGKHLQPGRSGGGTSRRDQTRLADPGAPLDRDEAAGALSGPQGEPPEQCELVRSLEQIRGCGQCGSFGAASNATAFLGGGPHREGALEVASIRRVEHRTGDPPADVGARPGEPVIVARGLTKRYGRTLAVDDLSFEVGRGKVTGFLGPTGAGKTTTLRMILGLAAPTAGEATIDGSPYGELEEPTRHVGAVLETTSFHPRRTVRNHLRLLASAGSGSERRVDEVLNRVGLTESATKHVGELAVGLRQRLGLASALLGDPRVLILDEPANSLDPAGIRWLREFLRSFAARGNAVFVSGHILAEMAQLADEVVVIDRGRLVVHAPVGELTMGVGREA